MIVLPSSFVVSLKHKRSVTKNGDVGEFLSLVIDEEANPHSSSVTNPENKEDKSRSDDTPILIARLETIRLFIALAAEKGWKIHHLNVKTTFINGDQKKLDSTLKEMAKFMAATAAVCQAIWLKEVLAEVTGNEQVIIEHVSGENQRADPLTKALARIRFKEMRSLLKAEEDDVAHTLEVMDEVEVKDMVRTTRKTKVYGQDAGARKASSQSGGSSQPSASQSIATGARSASSQAVGASQPIATPSTTNQGPTQHSEGPRQGFQAPRASLTSGSQRKTKKLVDL
ncbi:RNA-directed DNA polymerase, eukaryota [Tanacetum coccineum]